MFRRLLPLLLLAATLPPDAAIRARGAAEALLRSLPAGQARVATFPFEGRERKDLHLYPFFLDGLRLSELDDAGRSSLDALLGSVLSEEGLGQVHTVRALEEDVAALERDRGGVWRLVRKSRDPERYFLAIFGAPAGDSPWGFRFDGHHVSLNVTVPPGALPSVTPLFLGSQPRVVGEGSPRAGVQVLAEEEALARDLLLSLTEAQRASAILPFSPNRGMFLGVGARVAVWSPEGVPRSALDAAQRSTLDALIDVYLDRATIEIADAARARYAAAGLDNIRFAWAGSEVAGEPHYVRVHGPTFLLEFDNSLPGADHIHTIWRELDGDFGEDLLAAHYAAAHAGP